MDSKWVVVKYCATSVVFESSTGDRHGRKEKNDDGLWSSIAPQAWCSRAARGIVKVEKRKMMRGSGQVLRHKRGVQEQHCGIGKVEKKGGEVVVKYCAASVAFKSSTGYRQGREEMRKGSGQVLSRKRMIQEQHGVLSR